VKFDEGLVFDRVSEDNQGIEQTLRADGIEYVRDIGEIVDLDEERLRFLGLQMHEELLQRERVGDVYVPKAVKGADAGDEVAQPGSCVGVSPENGNAI
jgi:hypothetical protein